MCSTGSAALARVYEIERPSWLRRVYSNPVRTARRRRRRRVQCGTLTTARGFSAARPNRITTTEMSSRSAHVRVLYIIYIIIPTSSCYYYCHYGHCVLCVSPAAYTRSRYWRAFFYSSTCFFFYVFPPSPSRARRIPFRVPAGVGILVFIVRYAFIVVYSVRTACKMDTGRAARARRVLPRLAGVFEPVKCGPQQRRAHSVAVASIGRSWSRGFFSGNFG